jgi:type I site-specific restriction-modification system R (restriction) subunit
MITFTEDTVEQAALEWLGELGYAVLPGPDIAPDQPAAERGSYGEVVLHGRLRAALARLNPGLPPAALDDAFRRLTRPDRPSLEANNHALHRLIVDGVNVEYTKAEGRIAGAQARVLDYDDPDNNDWLAVNQFTVVEKGSHGGRSQHNRRPDIVLFVNGLPLAIIEATGASASSGTRRARQEPDDGLLRRAVILHPAMENPTLVVSPTATTSTTSCSAPSPAATTCCASRPVQAESREHLRELLKVASGGVVFTTIQKFFPEEKGATAPAAVRPAQHRRHRRRGPPQPVRLHRRLRPPHARRPAQRLVHRLHRHAHRADRQEHPAVFGDYISIYDIQRAVEDGATVPIYYESRLAKLELDEAEKPEDRPEFEEITEGEESSARRSSRPSGRRWRRWSGEKRHCS